MATAGGRDAAAVSPQEVRELDAPPSAAAPELVAPRANVEPAPLPGVLATMFAEGYSFDFFQAVRLLQRAEPGRRPLGHGGPPAREIARLRAHLSLTFPPSQIYEILPGTGERPPGVIVSFMGLFGPSGVLPRHYTELLMKLEKEQRGAERYAFRDWLDLFNHRLLSLFYRAWDKYRFPLAYERGEYELAEPDTFTRGLLALVGLGLPPLRNRLRVSVHVQEPAGEMEEGPRERVLGRVDDLALLHYGGLLSHRPRNAVSLHALLHDYFGLPVEVKQFQGQWLMIDTENQSQLGGPGSHSGIGLDLVAGERVWDTQGKIRVRVGPLNYVKFREFLPDRSPLPLYKSFFLLCHLVRLYVGLELEFDVQLVLKAEDVPACQLGGARLGWNTWVRNEPMPRDAEDALFESEEVVWLDGSSS